jgi:hypothetical protein
VRSAPFLIAGLFASLPAAAQAPGVTVPIGTPVVLATTAELSSKSNVKGDMVPLRVEEDVVVAGQVVLPRGSDAMGQIADARAKGAMGMSGQLLVRPLYAKVGDRIVRLSGGAADKASFTAGAIIGTVALGMPVFTGRSASIPAGTRLRAVVERTVILPALR